MSNINALSKCTIHGVYMVKAKRQMRLRPCLEMRSTGSSRAKDMAMSSDLPSGTVIHYPYLWRWQRERGETEGRKERPVCIVVAVQNPRDALTHLALLAITS